jgi:thioredoxin 1
LKGKIVLALFYASWCPFCRSLLQVFDEAASESRFACVKVRIDDYNNPLWEEYSITAVPTVILFVEGKLKERLDANLGRGLSSEKLAEWWKKFETVYCN